MLSFPFARVVSPIEVSTKDHRQWWQRRGRYPIQVTLEGTSASVGGSAYRLTPRAQGFACTRPGRAVLTGEIYEYGVRHALTTSFFHELSAVRSAVFGKSCPSPLCYEMPNGDLVHPGPCFTRHASSVIRRTRYTLTEDADEVCSVCQERFV